MTNLVKTNSDNSDFRELVILLDEDLQIRDGEEHSFYAQFNKVDKIRHVVVAYEDGEPVGCGAIKEYAEGVAEIKRMFVLPERRGHGVAKSILSELEAWANELNFSECILETGLKQPEAIGLYQKSGYETIPNYGQYNGVENSVCMKKSLAQTLTTKGENEEKSKREFLRHTLATVAYRGGKATTDAPESFAAMKASETTRTPVEILAHIGDLMDWALWMAREKPVWKDSEPLNWDEEMARFFDCLKKFDEFLASSEPLAQTCEKIFQGPIADALTHVGQINLLRRIHDAPVRGENYFRAEIEMGRVGHEQSANRIEFD
jgi:GNAT superfamily N-acetyltransferase